MSEKCAHIGLLTFDVIAISGLNTFFAPGETHCISELTLLATLSSL